MSSESSSNTSTSSPRLFRSTSIVAAMTMLSRLLGFVRDVALAEVFGAGAAFDAFVIAFKIPNFMRRLFAEGAFAQAFVPILAEFREKRPHEDTQAFVARVMGSLGFVLLLLVAVVEIIAPLVIMVFAPGFAHDGERYRLATHMLHIMFPYLLLIAMTAFCGAILNTFSRFAIPAFTPVLLNVSLIAVTWFLAPHATTPIYVLAWGVLLGGVLQIAIQLPSLKKLKLLPAPKLGFKDPDVKRVMKLMVPALFGVSVAQLSLLIDNVFASFLPTGSISWLYYSDRLTYLPLGVIGVAIATVVMPHLSRLHANESPKKFSSTLDWALRMVLLVGVPAAVGLFMMAGPLIATLFHHGPFNDFDVYMTRKSLLAFSLGLPGFMLVKVLASGFYSRKDIKTPVKIAAAALVVNLLFNALLILPLKHAGLALATSIASLFNAIMLWVFLLRHKVFVMQPGWVLFLLRLVIAAAIMAGFIFGLAGHTQQWLQWTLAKRVLQLIYIVVMAIAMYVVVLVVMGFRLKHIKPPA